MKYMVYYSERLHVESAVFAGQLIKEGAIGRVDSGDWLGTAPVESFVPAAMVLLRKQSTAGFLCDIGSHQVEQYLYFAGVKDAQVVGSLICNFNHRNIRVEDFGEVMLVGDNGATNYSGRLVWHEAWSGSDAGTIILGDKKKRAY